MEEIQLQPLRIVSGWSVDWNLFFEIDPSDETMRYLDSSSLLHLTNNAARRAIDLDWRPEGNPEGNYYLRVINLYEKENPRTKKIELEGDWENLYFEFTSKSRVKVVKEIERLVVQIPPFKE